MNFQLASQELTPGVTKDGRVIVACGTSKNAFHDAAKLAGGSGNQFLFRIPSECSCFLCADFFTAAILLEDA